jgi:hypothetical protein
MNEMNFTFPVSVCHIDLLMLHKSIFIVTAKEIYRALKHNHNRSQRMIVFFREIEDIDNFTSQNKSKFNDINDEETRQLFKDTKSDIQNSLPSDNIFHYQVYFNYFQMQSRKI